MLHAGFSFFTIKRIVSGLTLSMLCSLPALGQPVIKPITEGETGTQQSAPIISPSSSSDSRVTNPLINPITGQQNTPESIFSTPAVAPVAQSQPEKKATPPSQTEKQKIKPVDAPVLSSPEAGFGSRPEVVMLDRILVVVNNDVITEKELAIRINYMTKQLAAQHVSLPNSDEFAKQVLERMIVEKLQVQYAKEMGLQVTDEQLGTIVRRIIDNQHPGASEEEFRNALENDGIDYNYFREDLRKEVLISMVRQNEIEPKVQVSNDEIDNYLINQSADESQELNLSHIVINIPENADEATLKEKMAIVDTIMNELNAGGDFNQLAIRYSNAQDALEGGKMGWRLAEGIPSSYVDAIATIQPGQVATPIRSADGVHIVKLIERRQDSGTASEVQQYNVRHILLKPDEGNSVDVVRDRLLQIRETVREDPSKFEGLARQYSQDTSASNGGSLGWITPDEMVPEFGHAITVLPVGEISEPIETPYGWHIIQVTDKRMADVSDNNKRMAARKALQERKSEEMYQQWLKEQRDQSFIEFKEYFND